MSSTGRGAARADLDFYETPSWATRAILRALHDRSALGASVLDAGCGTGAILRELNHTHFLARGIEIDNARAASAQTSGLDVWQGDFLAYEPIGARHEIVISNPPYSLAMEFVVHAMKLSSVVCMLLRLPWLASLERADWHRAHPAHVNVLPRRPSFCISASCKKKCGWQVSLPVDAERPKICDACGEKTSISATDSADYAWFIWGTEHAGRHTILEVEPAKEKRAA